jgi:hypothetical protein
LLYKSIRTQNPFKDLPCQPGERLVYARADEQYSCSPSLLSQQQAAIKASMQECASPLTLKRRLRARIGLTKSQRWWLYEQ